MISKDKKTVLVIGASDKPDRYSNRAIKMLQDYGYQPVGIHPHLRVAEEAPVFPSIQDLPQDIRDDIHSVTMYVGAALSDKMTDDLSQLKPPRIIWNPGSENPQVQQKLTQQGIHNLEACTLVLLSTHQFAND